MAIDKSEFSLVSFVIIYEKSDFSLKYPLSTSRSMTLILIKSTFIYRGQLISQRIFNHYCSDLRNVQAFLEIRDFEKVAQQFVQQLTQTLRVCGLQ